MPDLQLFQSISSEVAQNDSEETILLNLQLFQSFPTKVAQNDLEQPILPDSQLFQSFPTKGAQNDWKLSILPDSQLFQCKKRPPKSSKNEMFIFGLHSACDDWPSDPSDESQLKCEKGLLSDQKMKCLFLDYVQLLMIG